MERFLKQHDKDSMKMAMLKHEETFRQQVHELHRLYRVQKLLMRDMKIKELKRQQQPICSHIDFNRWNMRNEAGCDRPYYDHQQSQRRPTRRLNLELPAEEYMEAHNITESDDENGLELTLATGRSRRKKEERSYTSDSGTSFSSSSGESGRVKLNGQFQVPDMSLGFHSERKNGLDVEGPIREDRMKHSPWLLQCLSLNLT